MTILANISSLENVLLHLDLSLEERQLTDELLSSIRSEAIQLAHQESPHNSSALRQGAASAASRPC